MAVIPRVGPEVGAPLLQPGRWLAPHIMTLLMVQLRRALTFPLRGGVIAVS